MERTKLIGCSSFLEQLHLTDPATGYLYKGAAFKNVKSWVDNSINYAIFDNIEPDGRYTELLKDTSLHKIFRPQHGSVWAEVYQRGIR